MWHSVTAPAAPFAAQRPAARRRQARVVCASSQLRCAASSARRWRSASLAARRQTELLSFVPPPLVLVLYEDEHLLVVHKPAGWNTHAPAPLAAEGVYDWLRSREPRWATLSLHHRLDKETSGVLVFGLSALANKRLAAQWEARSVSKSYSLHTASKRRLPNAAPGLSLCAQADGWLRVTSALQRQGERYVVQPCDDSGAGAAVTLFRQAAPGIFEARPVTGRTHQIRVHSAALGIPVLGDTLYGGAASERVWLHAASLSLLHPTDSRAITFDAPADVPGNRRWTISRAIADWRETSLVRINNSRELSVDLLGDTVLTQSENAGDPAAAHALLGTTPLGEGSAPVARVYHKTLRRDVRAVNEPADMSPRLLAGSAGEDRVVVRENGALFELSFTDGYSVGLFHDQRDNRRRLATGYVSESFGALWPARRSVPPTLLNCFAYTCGFSVAAALGGAQTTSLDVSRKYLAWGQERNFALNGLDTAQHDFIYGDCFEWLRRLANKGRTFDAVLLDPPTYSSTKTGRFSAERDYGLLVAAALPLLAPGGVLLASTNAARMTPLSFVTDVKAAVLAAGRSVLLEHFATQPPDFPPTRDEPAYLKTLWLRIS